MLDLTAVYVDFQCPYSYRAWRWLSRLPERDAVDVRPYSLDTDSGEHRNPWDRESPTRGLELLALGELARDTGRAAHLQFVDAAFAAVHGPGADLSSPEAWLRLGAGAALDLNAFTADSERWRAEVGLWHQEAEDEFGVFGTPTLLFDSQAGLFLKLGGQIDSDDAARRLLDDLADLADQPVAEVERTTT